MQVKSPTPIIEIYLSKFQTDVGKSWFATRQKEPHKNREKNQSKREMSDGQC